MSDILPPVGGIHHVTAIAGDPQENVEFYAGLLGMRLVKRSVNQDDPGTYHLFYADAAAHPGSDLTFFPWAHAAPGRNGAGLVNEVHLAVPPESLEYWRNRLEKHGVSVRDAPPQFGERGLAFTDPHGLRLALVATPRALERPFTAWHRSPVSEEWQVRGLHAVKNVVHSAEHSAAVATRLLGMRPVAEEDGWTRYEGRDPWSGHLDLKAAPDQPRGHWGVGTVHHVAWRVKDDLEHTTLQRAVTQAGLRPTEVIDRFWFQSVYFREPGGVLYELATDGPGFIVDEPLETLGEKLVLPPWLEVHRKAIEEALPPLSLPHERAVRTPEEAQREA